MNKVDTMQDNQVKC